MKSHLLQTAKLTAKSFFHSQSDPGFIVIIIFPKRLEIKQENLL